MRYCNQWCQKAHWFIHKKECKSLAGITTALTYHNLLNKYLVSFRGLPCVNFLNVLLNFAEEFKRRQEEIKAQEEKDQKKKEEEEKLQKDEKNEEETNGEIKESQNEAEDADSLSQKIEKTQIQGEDDGQTDKGASGEGPNQNNSESRSEK